MSVLSPFVIVSCLLCSFLGVQRCRIVTLAYPNTARRIICGFLRVRAALATELPSQDLLLEAPHGRTESVISRKMWKHILVQGCYQILVLFLIIYAASKLFPTTYGVRWRATHAICCVAARFVNQAAGSSGCVLLHLHIV